MTGRRSEADDHSKLRLSRRRALQLSSGAAVGGTIFGEGPGEANAASEDGEDDSERDDDEVEVHGPSDQQIGGPTEVIKGVPETYSVNRADHLDFAWSAENGTVDEDGPEAEVTFHSTGEQKVRVMVAVDGVPDAVGHLDISVSEIEVDGPEEAAVGQSYEFEVDDPTGDVTIQHWTVTPHDAGSVIVQSEEYVGIEFEEEASPATIEVEYETDSGYTDTASHEVDVEQIELQIENARLVQTVENTRVEDTDGTVLWDDEPDPDFVAGRNASIGFDLNGEHIELLEEDVTVVVDRDYESTGGSRLMSQSRDSSTLHYHGEFELQVTDDRNDVEAFVDAAHGIDFLDTLATEHDVDVPVFPLYTHRDLASVEIRIESDIVDSEPVTIEEGTDFSVSNPRTLRVGFIALKDPDEGENYGRDNDGYPFSRNGWREEYMEAVDEAVEMTKKVYPVDEIEVYAHEKLMKGAVGIFDNAIDDGVEAQDIIEEEFPEFDATILVVPWDYFRFHQGEDSTTRGTHFKSDGVNLFSQPAAADVVREDVMDEMTPAHEMGHTFTEELYKGPLNTDPQYEDHPVAQREGPALYGVELDFEHARGSTDGECLERDDEDNCVDRWEDHPAVRMTKFDLADGTYEMQREHVPSVMSYDRIDTRWADSRLFQELLDDGFDPTPPESSSWLVTSSGVATDERIEVLSGIATIEDDGTATIRYMRQREGKPMPPGDEGNVSLTLRSADGEELGTVTTADEWVGVAEESVPIPDTVPFTVPYPEELDTLVFEREGTTSTVDPRGRLLASAKDRIAEKSFIKNPEDRLPSLQDKLDSVDNQLQNSSYKAAYNKLTNDVRPRVVEWLHDDADVPANYYTKSELLALLDDVISRLEALYDVHDDLPGCGPPDEHPGQGPPEDHPGRGPPEDTPGRGPPDEPPGCDPSDDEPGRGPPDDDDDPGRGPPDDDDDPGRGPPDDDDDDDDPPGDGPPGDDDDDDDPPGNGPPGDDDDDDDPPGGGPPDDDDDRGNRDDRSGASTVMDGLKSLDFDSVSRYWARLR